MTVQTNGGCCENSNRNVEFRIFLDNIYVCLKLFGYEYQVNDIPIADFIRTKHFEIFEYCKNGIFSRCFSRGGSP